jgi:putative hydrolase of HD superfamily
MADDTRLSFDAIFTFADEMEILQRLPRTGYVMSGVSEPQTVGAHTAAVALWCLLLLERMAERDTIDRCKVLGMAVLHEMGEARLSDIPHPARRYLGPEAVSAAERQAVDEMLADMPAEWRELWHEFEDGETLEARVVKAADKLELMHRILCYERYGNGEFERFWQWDPNFRSAGLDAAAELFDEMKRRHHSDVRRET